MKKNKILVIISAIILAYMLPSFFIKLGFASQFTTIKININQTKINLYLYDNNKKYFNNFANLNQYLIKNNKKIIFAMNAGMYESDSSPVGLFISNEMLIKKINLTTGKGNFYMPNNGVFYQDQRGAYILSSQKYYELNQNNPKNIQFATQSGPLLVENNKINPNFNLNSKSRYIRNGVGVSGNIVFFVISDVPVTFYEMARYFKEDLQCANALYLDGAVSSLWSVALNRYESHANLGPILGITE